MIISCNVSPSTIHSDVLLFLCIVRIALKLRFLFKATYALIRSLIPAHIKFREFYDGREDLCTRS